MTTYRTRDELVAAYASTCPTLHKQFHIGAAVYVPHIYRGGWVVRGFGFSVERIGKYVTKETAGDPLAV